MATFLTTVSDLRPGISRILRVKFGQCEGRGGVTLHTDVGASERPGMHVYYFRLKRQLTIPLEVFQ